RLAYVGLGGTPRLGIAGGTLARLVISAAVLSVSTVLMGGTLPAATRSVETDQDSARRLLAILYGANTLGAVAGTVLSNFLLLEFLGTRGTLWTACGVNAVVGLLALRLSRAEPPAAEAKPAVREKRKEKERDRRAEHASRPSPALEASRPAAGFVLFAAGVVGFFFFLMDIVWYRILAPL